MQEFRLPLSGNVAQSIWSPFQSVFGNQFSLVSVNLGKSSAPEVEERVLNEVGSYGKQLGRIGDAVAVLMRHLPKEGLTHAEQKALIALEVMLDDVAGIKAETGRTAPRA